MRGEAAGMRGSGMCPSAAPALTTLTLSLSNLTHHSPLHTYQVLGMTIFVFFLVPETKGVPLEEM